MSKIVGGGDSSPSTGRDFTCCWCLGGGEPISIKHSGNQTTVVQPDDIEQGFENNV